jgi:hypothetical protein
MRSYFATQGKRVQEGGWQSVLIWANEQIQTDPTPVKILTARAGDRTARVVAEVTQEGGRLIEQGREVPLRSLSGKT